MNLAFRGASLSTRRVPFEYTCRPNPGENPMKKLSVPALMLSLALAMPALAKEKAGVNVPETVTVEGKALKLNGVGLRKKAIFKVYVAALYAENTSKEAATFLNSDQVKQVKMVMLRDLEKSKIVDAVKDGFEKNNKAQMPALQERLNNFTASIPDVKKGDTLTLTYVPGKGTSVTSKTGQALSVQGKDFADALFSVWLGKHPVDGSLKDGMLGKD
jgi:hypothetical protein